MFRSVGHLGRSGDHGLPFLNTCVSFSDSPVQLQDMGVCEEFRTRAFARAEKPWKKFQAKGERRPLLTAPDRYREQRGKTEFPRVGISGLAAGGGFLS
jgi:hypothetical protein